MKARVSTAVRAAVPSPCISVCAMDEATGWCEGCLRTLDEITSWGAMDEDAKRLLLRQLGPRRVLWRASRSAPP
jgi:predicted Fe-S protein YdhL (DUF1289 family)